MQNLWQLTSILLGLLWLTLGSTANAGKTPTLALDHATAHIRLSAEQILTCETLRSIDQPSPFTVEPCQLTAPNTHANAYPMYHPPSHKAPHNVVWIAFTLHNTTDQALEIWLTTGHPLIEHIRVWQSHRPEPYDIGSQTPIQLKPIRHHEPIVPILLPAQAQITLMIGYASSTYINTQIDLWQPSAYLEEAQQNAFSHTLIFGALSLTSLLSLLAYLGLRHRFYAFLTLTLVTETLLLIGQSGKLPAFYLAVALSGYTPTLWIIGGIHLVSYALFVHYFLRHLHVNFQQSNHHTEWFIRLFIVIFVVEGIALILLFIGSPYIDHPIDIGAVSLLLSLPLILFSSRLQNKLLEQKIKQQTQENEATAKFLREVNHEIRAPLNRVLTQALDIERPSLREKIIQNCRHVLLTIDEALSYSNTLRPIATVDQTVLTSQAFLDLLAQSGQEIVERTYREHHNSFIFNAQVSLYPWIMIDERRVMQIFDNLITNAARYTRKGKVQLTLTTKPSMPAFQSALPSAPTSDESTILTVIIQDTGMGISQEDQLRIFEPFVRGGAGMRSGCHGSGMGLAIVKQLVEQLEGSIKLKSEEGKGTQLTVTLPIYPASAELYQEHQSTHSTHFTRPNAETIKHLTTLIQQGGISDIIRWANQLSNEHPDLARFAQEITQSAVKGDMTRLRQLARPAETSVPAD